LPLSRAAATSRSSPEAFSLWATGLAISRAVEAMMSSRTTSPFSRSVVPVCVRSTIASTIPVSGASSTEPLTSTISAWRPVSSKYAAAIRGYLVATRTTPRRRSASTAGSGSPATAERLAHARVVDLEDRARVVAEPAHEAEVEDDALHHVLGQLLVHRAQPLDRVAGHALEDLGAAAALRDVEDLVGVDAERD